MQRRVPRTSSYHRIGLTTVDEAGPCNAFLPVRNDWLLFHLGLVHRDRLDGDLQAGIRDPQLGGRPRGRLLWEELLVGLLHRLEIRGVHEEDRRLDDRPQGEAHVLEDRRDVCEALSGWSRDA